MSCIIPEHHVEQRDVEDTIAKDVATNTKCDRTCVVIAIGCVLALFLLILVVALCYAMNSHTGKCCTSVIYMYI